MPCLSLAIALATFTGCKKKPADSVGPMSPGNGAAAAQVDPMAMYVRGVQAAQRGERDAAIADLSAAVAAKGDMISARQLLGDLYRQSGQWAKAAEQYEAVSRLDPNDWKAQMNLGLARLASGQAKTAVEPARAAAKLQPQNPIVWANLGAALDAAGELSDAEGAYRKSLQLDANQPAVRMNLASNLMSQNMAAEALPVLEPIAQSQPSARLHHMLGDAMTASGRGAEAEAQYQAAIKLDPNYYPALNALGARRMKEYRDDVLADPAKLQTALDFYKRSLAINPRQPEIAAVVNSANR